MTGCLDKGLVRKRITGYVYACASVAWTPSRDFPEISERLSEGKDVTVYRKGTVYHGMPFTVYRKSSLDAFSEGCREGEYAVPENVVDMLGTDCVGYILCSVSPYMKIPVDYLSVDLLEDRRYTRPLGGVVVGAKQGSWMVRKAHSEKDFYEAYALVEPADIVVTYFRKDFGKFIGHTRIATGGTVVVRNSDGDIDPYRSYLVLTECKHTLTGRDSNFRVDRKFFFRSLYENCYIPLRFVFLFDN